MTYYLELGDYCRIAAEVLGLDPDTDVPMVERIAAGEAARDEIVAWLRTRAGTNG